MNKSRLDQTLLDIPLWHFVWIAVVLSTLLSLLMSELIHGDIRWQYPFTASLISLVVASLVIAVIQRLRKLLVDREARLRAILDHSSAMIFIKGMNGRYIGANRQFLNTFHFTREAVIGKTDADLFSAAQAAIFRANDLRVLECRHSLEFEEVIPHDDGPHTSLVLRYPVCTSTGILYATGGIATDITERKKAECALHEARQALEAVLDEREQLTGALHDNIIQMLYATGMMLEIAQHEVLSEPSRTKDRIQAAIAQIRTTMTDIRSYITENDLPWLKSPDHLEASLRELITMLVQTGGMRIEFEMDPRVLTYLGPSVVPHLFYITEEALSNSIRHSRAHHGMVSLCLHENSVRLKIEDDGQGFDPPAGIASGQGLRNIQTRAKRVGGDICIRSVPGQGTHIDLDIPIRPATVSPSPASR